MTELNGNDLYRIGDCILNDKDLYKKIIENKNKFNNTFLYAFSIQWAKQYSNFSTFSLPLTIYKNRKITLAAKIVTQFIQTRRYKLPARDALVIHLRLGDTFSKDELIGTHAKPNMKNILNNIKTYDIKKIIIVTAYHNHTNNILTIEYNNMKSKEFLNELINNISKTYNVSIRSSINIDSDFFFLCAAKHLLLTGKSGFGTVAQDIGQLLQFK